MKSRESWLLNLSPTQCCDVTNATTLWHQLQDFGSEFMQWNIFYFLCRKSSVLDVIDYYCKPSGGDPQRLWSVVSEKHSQIWQKMTVLRLSRFLDVYKARLWEHFLMRFLDSYTASPCLWAHRDSTKQTAACRSWSPWAVNPEQGGGSVSASVSKASAPLFAGWWHQPD